MKLNKLAASLALIVSTTAMAGFDGYSDRASSATSPSVAFTQEVLDRNMNPFFGKTDHYNRIYWSGLIKAYGGFSTYDPSIARFGKKKTVTDIFTPRANIYMDTMINEWATGHIGLTFGLSDIHVNQSINGLSGILFRDDESSYRRFGIVDEAVVTVGNVQKNPAYFRVGVGYVPFGNYKRNQPQMSLVQALTQTQVQYAQIGFVDSSGFNGAAYAFRGAKKFTSDSPTVNNGGLQLGYCMDEGNWGADFTVDWMYNMAGAVNTLTAIPGGVVSGPGISNDAVMGLHLGVKGYYNEFDGQVFFVSALKNFSNPGPVAAGKKPAALHVEVGFSFPMADMDSRIGVNYQQSFNARLIGNPINASNAPVLGNLAPALGLGGVPHFENVTLPEYRVAGNLTMKVVKNVEAGVHVIWSNPYKPSTASRGDSILTGLLSLSARLA